MKKTCIIYNSWGDIIRELPAEMAGELTKAILAYAFDGEEISISDPALKATFIMMRKKLDEDREKYDSQVDRMNKNRSQQEVSKKSARSHKEVSKKSYRSHTEVESVSVSDSVSDSVSVSDKEPKTEVSGDVQAVIDAWNDLPDTIPKVKAITDSGSRAKLLKARIKEYGATEVISAIKNISKSDFLQGKTGKGWRITFDWFITPNNFKKVYEGNYNTEETKNESRDDYWADLYETYNAAIREKADNNNSCGGDGGGGNRGP